MLNPDFVHVWVMMLSFFRAITCASCRRESITVIDSIHIRYTLRRETSTAIVLTFCELFRRSHHPHMTLTCHARTTSPPSLHVLTTCPNADLRTTTLTSVVDNDNVSAHALAASRPDCAHTYASARCRLYDAAGVRTIENMRPRATSGDSCARAHVDDFDNNRICVPPFVVRVTSCATRTHRHVSSTMRTPDARLHVLQNVVNDANALMPIRKIVTRHCVPPNDILDPH